MWRYSQCRALYTRGGGSESHEIFANRQIRVRDLDGPIDPMSYLLLNVIGEGVLGDHRRVDLEHLSQPRGEFDVNGGPPRALRNAAGVGIPFPYARTVGNGTSVSSREQSVRRRECTLFPAVHERGYYQRETGMLVVCHHPTTKRRGGDRPWQNIIPQHGRPTIVFGY